MIEMTWPLGLFCAAIVLVIGFVLIAPTGILARATNAVGNTIQMIVAWIRNLFS